MKRIIKLGVVVVLFAFGIAIRVAAAEGEYKSRIKAEDCFLCGDHSYTDHSPYWGQDNVGLVHLNTFDVLPLRINRYGDSDELIKEQFGIMESSGLYRDDTYANAITLPDRGYASIEISGVKYKVDRTSVQTHLCETCIQAMNCVYWSEENPPEFAIVSFNDGTIRPLDRAITWFFSGNFGISCEYEEGGDIDLLIAYLPPRWEEAE